jgi:hypothetical protein
MAHRPATLQRHYVTKASLLNNLLRTEIIFRRNKLFKVAIGVKIAWITRKCMADSTDCQRSTFRQGYCMFYIGACQFVSQLHVRKVTIAFWMVSFAKDIQTNVRYTQNFKIRP